jgi:hypothetical protein
MIKVIIAGTRTFTDYTYLKSKLDFLLAKKHPDIDVVSGCARGADTLGERYAREKGYSVKKFPANWDTYGKKAGYLRNKDMAEYASHAVIFWDGSSRGTKSMIELCQAYSLIYRVFRV